MKRAHLTVLAILTLPAAAGDYTLEPSANANGGASASTDYSVRTCATPGGTGASADYTLRAGFAGQLVETSGIGLSSPSPMINEGSSMTLAAEWRFDDDTHAPLDAAELTWSVVSGPLVGVAADGGVTAAAVYQNEPAVVRAQQDAFEDSLALTVIDSLPDNYGTYAADALPDSWQIQYFGLNFPEAGRFDDPDDDGVSNLLEYAAGCHPASAASGVAPLSYQGNVIVPGKPRIEYVPAPGVLPYRALFVRRKSAPSLSYLPQFSRNLTSWSAATTPLVVLADDGVYQVVSHRFPVTIGGLRSSNKFFRLHVATTP